VAPKLPFLTLSDSNSNHLKNSSYWEQPFDPVERLRCRVALIVKLPFRKACHLVNVIGKLVGFVGKSTKPFSIVLVTECSRIILSIFGS
jgi:hypothetical protein